MRALTMLWLAAALVSIGLLAALEPRWPWLLTLAASVAGYLVTNTRRRAADLEHGRQDEDADGDVGDEA